jgi:dsDNA-binding SOS-regulon protein
MVVTKELDIPETIKESGEVIDKILDKATRIHGDAQDASIRRLEQQNRHSEEVIKEKNQLLLAQRNEEILHQLKNGPLEQQQEVGLENLPHQPVMYTSICDSLMSIAKF